MRRGGSCSTLPPMRATCKNGHLRPPEEKRHRRALLTLRCSRTEAIVSLRGEEMTRYLVAEGERGEGVRGEAPSFDEAYELALSLGGNLHVVPLLGTGAGKPPRVGSVEYVPAVQS